MADMTSTERLNDFEQRIDAQKARVARAQVEREQAEASLAATKEALKEEFGATTAADIKRVRDELVAKLDEQLEAISSDLETAGA